MFLFLGLGFGIAALGLLGGAIWVYFKQQRQMDSRVTANGTVVELTDRVTTGGRGGSICPVVEFSVPSGERIRFTSDFGSRPASHKVGQSVTVRYEPVDPQKAEVESAMNIWLTPLILVFMGAIACCLTIAFLGGYLLSLPSISP